MHANVVYIGASRPFVLICALEIILLTYLLTGRSNNTEGKPKNKAHYDHWLQVFFPKEKSTLTNHGARNKIGNV